MMYFSDFSFFFFLGPAGPGDPTPGDLIASRTRVNSMFYVYVCFENVDHPGAKREAPQGLFGMCEYSSDTFASNVDFPKEVSVRFNLYRKLKPHIFGNT